MGMQLIKVEFWKGLTKREIILNAFYSFYGLVTYIPYEKFLKEFNKIEKIVVEGVDGINTINRIVKKCYCINNDDEDYVLKWFYKRKKVIEMTEFEDILSNMFIYKCKKSKYICIFPIDEHEGNTCFKVKGHISKELIKLIAILFYQGIDNNDLKIIKNMLKKH